MHPYFLYFKDIFMIYDHQFFSFLLAKSFGVAWLIIWLIMYKWKESIKILGNIKIIDNIRKINTRKLYKY